MRLVDTRSVLVGRACQYEVAKSLDWCYERAGGRPEHGFAFEF